MISLLYVDDEVGLLEIAKLFLENIGNFSVTTIDSAKDALDLMGVTPFDAIISDYQMPGMDGIQFLVEVRAKFGQVPFILFTGKGREEVVIQAINSGADFYVQKGGEPEAQFAELAHKIKKAVEGRRAEEADRASRTRLTRSEANLTIHKTELEAQAEELKRTKLEAETSRDRFLDLYDFAPVGYLTLSNTALIAEVNLTGATLLGIERNRLVKAQFSKFVAEKDADEWHRYFLNLLNQEEKRSCALMLSRGDREEFPARLEGIRITGTDGTDTVRIAFTDISDLRHTEETLRESEERYRLLHDNAAIGIGYYTPDGIIISYNPVAASYMGGRPEDFAGKSIFDLFPKEDADRYYNRILKAAGSRESVMYEDKVLLPQGKLSFLSTFSRITSSGGGIVGIQVIAQEITRLKRAEEALQKDLEAMTVLYGLGLSKATTGNLSELLTGIVDAAIAITSADFGNIQLLDPDTGHLRIVAHRNFPDWWLAFWETVSEGKGTCGTALACEERVIVPDIEKSAIFVGTPALEIQQRAGIRAVQSTPLRSRDGRIIGMFSTQFRKPYQPDDRQMRLLDLLARQAADLIEQSRYEENLQKSEEKYRTLFMMAADGIIVHDNQGRNIDVNAQACEMLGYSRDELLAMRVSDLIQPEELQENPPRLAEALAGQPVRYERKLRRKNGTLLDVEIRASRIAEGIVQAFWRDITERKQAEEALNVAHQQFQVAMDTGKLAWWNMDCKTGNVTFHDNKTRMLGYSPEPFKHYTDFTNKLHPDDYEPAMQAMRDHISGVKPRYDIEYRIIDANGKYHWFRDVGGISKTDSNGDPEIVTGIVIDISDRKRGEEALKKSEDRFRHISETITNFAYSCIQTSGNSFQVDWISGPVEKITGYTPDEIISMTCWRPLVIDEDLSIFDSKIIGLSPGESAQCELRIRRRDGDIAWLASFAECVLGPENPGESILYGAIQDITDRKRAEDAVRLSGMKFQRLVEATPDMIWEIDPHGNFTYISPQSTIQLGYTPEELIGKSMFSIVKPESIPSIRNQFLTHIQGKKSFNLVEVPAYHRNGNSIVVEIRSALIANDQGEIIGFQGIARDITDRKRAEEALHLANKKLNLLTSVTRHDINNQLTVLQGYLNILEKKQSDLIQKDYFQKASASAQRISSMIRFTKEYEQIGINSPVWQDCRTIVEIVVKDTPLGKVTIKNDIPAGIEVFADPLIVKVFYTLMDNAVRYGGKITTIGFSIEEHMGDHVIVCEDDGIGIPKEDKERIFDRGFGKNTGLGLFLAREILAITGLEIHETGEPGKGARFEITVQKGMWR